MIHVCLESLPEGAEEALEKLGSYQRAIDALTSPRERARVATAEWESKQGSRPVRVAREMLRRMCSGVDRCMYCEDSAGTNIEHYRPKSLFPDLVFAWSNLLLACAGCDTRKGSSFAVLDPDTASPADPSGLLINPRYDEPNRLLHLVLKTGLLVEAKPPGTPEHERASYTLRLLGLNDRGLPEARARMFRSYRKVLNEHVLRKRGESEGPASTREIIRDHVHRVVWVEMKQQRDRYPELRDLFAAAPEALDW